MDRPTWSHRLAKRIDAFFVSQQKTIVNKLDRPGSRIAILISTTAATTRVKGKQKGNSANGVGVHVGQCAA